MSSLTITITLSRRQDYGQGIEPVTHRVLVETTGGKALEVEVLCRAWALRCADDRRVEPLDL